MKKRIRSSATKIILDRETLLNLTTVELDRLRDVVGGASRNPTHPDTPGCAPR